MKAPTVTCYSRETITEAGFVSLGKLPPGQMTLARHQKLAFDTNTPAEYVTAFRMAPGEWEAFAKADKLGTGYTSTPILPR